MQENREQGTETFVIEGRNAVLEAFRSGRTIDKIYILDGCQDGPVRISDQFCDKRKTFPALRDREASGRDRACGSI